MKHNDATATETPTSIIFFMLISAISILSNVAVLYLYYSKLTALLKKPSNRLLISMAVCDLFTSLGLILTTINFVMADINISYRILVDIYEDYFVKCLVFHLCGLALDRYIALFFALRYQAIVTNKNVTRYIAIAWILPFISSGLQFAWLYNNIAGETVTKQADIKISRLDFWYSLISFVIFLALPMIYLAIAFIAMAVEIRRIVRNTPGRTLRQESGKCDSHSTYVFSAMYVSFLLLAMPYYSLRLRNDLHGYQNSACRDMHTSLVCRFVVGVKYLTSVVRPILYVFTSFEIHSCLSPHREDPVLSHRRSQRVQEQDSCCSTPLVQAKPLNSHPSTSVGNHIDSKDLDI